MMHPKRLNLGCGYDYRPGYLNVDLYNGLLCDLKQSLETLELPAGHFTEIMLGDVIEHLGYCESFFLLAELHTALREDGELRIRTPDFDRAAAQYLAASTPEEREAVLCWIYGTEDPGMGHKFCFPAECLEMLLSKSGFSVRESGREARIPHQPALLITAGKITDPAFARRNRLVHRVRREGPVSIGYLDLPYFERLLSEFLAVGSADELERFVKNARAVSPKLALAFIRCDEAHLSYPKLSSLCESLKGLTRANFFGLFESAADAELDFEAALSRVQEFAAAPGACKDSEFKADFFTKEQYGAFACFRAGLKRKEKDGHNHTA